MLQLAETVPFRVHRFMLKFLCISKFLILGETETKGRGERWLGEGKNFGQLKEVVA